MKLPSVALPRVSSRRASQLCWASAVLAELGFWLAVSHDDALPALAMRIFAALAAACAALDTSISGVQRKRAVFAAVLCLVLTLPGVGLFALLGVLLPAWSKHGPFADLTLRTEPGHSFDGDALERALRTGEHGQPLSGYGADAVGLRMRAVAALGRVADRTAAPLLRASLGDRAEEVRLLAHAVLEKKERAIRARIAVAADKLARAEASTRNAEQCGKLGLGLAEVCFELAESGLLGERARSEQLAFAARTAEAVEASSVVAEAALLRARIGLACGDTGAAHWALQQAEAHGKSRAATLPLWAELSLLRGDVAELGLHLGELPAGPEEAPAHARARALWQRSSARWNG